MTKPNDDPSRVLARSLANNHVCSSLGPGYDREKVMIRGAMDSEYKRRVVAVVGSGASVDAGLPGTEDALNEIRKSTPLPKKVFNKELNRLESVHKFDRNQFETCLMA